MYFVFLIACFFYCFCLFLSFNLFSFCLSSHFFSLFLHHLIPLHWLETGGGGLLCILVIGYVAVSGWVMTLPCFQFFLFFFFFLPTTNQSKTLSICSIIFRLKVGDRYVKIITHIEHLIIYFFENKFFLIFFRFTLFSTITWVDMLARVQSHL